MNLEQIKNIAVKAAYEGGGILREHFTKGTVVHKKGAIDLVTEADIASEKAIVQTIHGKFPDHAVLAEERGSQAGDKHYRWIIDPLDGTTNFAHGLGIFSISIAFAHDDRIVVGVVLNPIGGELFSAVAGEGAFLNHTAISVSDTDKVGESLLVTGFPYNMHAIFPAIAERFRTCLQHARGIRRLGSAALDLCYLACGRFDGFWEQHLHPWDTAAGVLIAEEAGAVVSDFSNRPYCIYEKEILATNGKIHYDMLDLLKISSIDNIQKKGRA